MINSKKNMINNIKIMKDQFKPLIKWNNKAKI